jgi:ADP-ribose pyrophosphatase
MKIPKNAKQVFKGIIFSIYQWKQKMYDGKLATFEILKRQDSVVVITEYQKKMVVIKQKQPGHSWFLSEPSGRMDIEGESPKNAAIRELLEETGLKAGKIFLWKKVIPSRKMDYTVYIFIAKNCTKIAEQSLDNGEKIQVMLLDFEKWLTLSDDPTYIEGATLIDMLKARLHPSYKKELKKLILDK